MEIERLIQFKLVNKMVVKLINPNSLLFSRAHEGEEEDIADGMDASKEHDEAVDADAKPSGRRHALADRLR